MYDYVGMAVHNNPPPGELFDIECGESRTRTRDGLALEIGTKDKQRIVVDEQIDKAMQLIFAGTVTLRKSALCFPICMVVNTLQTCSVPLFVSGESYKDVTSECPVPAWHCRVVQGSGNLDLQFEKVCRGLPKKLADDPCFGRLGDGNHGDDKVCFLVPRLVPGTAKANTAEVDTSGIVELTYSRRKAPKRKRGKDVNADFLQLIGGGGLCNQRLALLAESRSAAPEKMRVPKGVEWAHLLR